MEKATFLLEWFPNPDHVPLYVALKKGFFQENGVDVSILVPSDPDDPMKLAAARKVDFALNYQPSVILTRSQGQAVVSMGLLIDHTLDTVMFLRSSGIKSPGDLKGKRIGFAVAPFDQAMFNALAEHASLKRSDYEFVDVGFNFTQALLTGQADAVMGAFKNYEKIEAELAGADVGIFELAENGVPDFYQLIVVANEDVLKTDPEMARGVVKGMALGIGFTLENPEEALEVFFSANPTLRNELNRRAFDATIPLFASFQGQSHEKWAVFQRFMLKCGLIEKETSVGDLFTNEFSY
ncbi:MAG: ABC transporter substrate-binding protein [Chloroflexi bacterium]|nr:ABC transporter substrate-binding protein [Chloroflexota bacterium]